MTGKKLLFKLENFIFTESDLQSFFGLGRDFRTESMDDWWIVRWIDWLTAWLIDPLMHWFIDRLVSWLIDRFRRFRFSVTGPSTWYTTNLKSGASDPHRPPAGRPLSAGYWCTRCTLSSTTPFPTARRNASLSGACIIFHWHFCHVLFPSSVLNNLLFFGLTAWWQWNFVASPFQLSPTFRYAATFGLSIAWIAVFSYIMVWMVSQTVKLTFSTSFFYFCKFAVNFFHLSVISKFLSIRQGFFQFLPFLLTFLIFFFFILSNVFYESVMKFLFFPYFHSFICHFFVLVFLMFKLFSFRFWFSIQMSSFS